MEKRGLIIKDHGIENTFLNFKPAEPMDCIHSSSITYRIALGKYKGQKTLTIGNVENFRSQKNKDKPFLSKYSNFSLHVGISGQKDLREFLE